MSRRSAAALALALALLAAGCGSEAPPRTVIGVRKVSLAMVFSDQALKVPVPPRIVVKLVPAEPQAIIEQVPEAEPYLAPIRPAPSVPSPPSVLACKKAPKDAPLPEPAPTAIVLPAAPKEGTYLQQNRGTIRLAGPVPLTFPYPPLTKVVVRGVRTYDVFDAEFGQKRHTTFIVEDQITSDIRTISEYDHDDEVLNLVRREVVNGATSTVLAPTPPVEVLGFGGPQSSWTSAGVDLDTGTALTITGSISPNQAVDVCGTLVDTITASTDERQVTPASGDQSGSRPNQPIITGWATQLGGLPIRREQHTTQIISTEDGPVALETDVVSTFTSTNPLPPGSFP